MRDPLSGDVVVRLDAAGVCDLKEMAEATRQSERSVLCSALAAYRLLLELESEDRIITVVDPSGKNETVRFSPSTGVLGLARGHWFMRPPPLWVFLIGWWVLALVFILTRA